MSTTTQCPQCNTRFKVTQEQLDAHLGMVRCGRCQAVFNATEYLHDDEPSPQLDLPIVPEPTPPAPTEATPSHEAEGFSLTPPTNMWGQNKSLSTEQAPAPVTLKQRFSFAEKAIEGTPASKKLWPWAIGSLLLLILLLAQIAYFFRVELAARLPGLKPVLVSYCGLLHCTVALPQKADQMSIESSDLEVTDPAQPNVIIFNATLRNRAPYAQAYPHLELTLTDAQEKPLARRTFRPSEYLKLDEDEKQGVASNREINVKLHLDTTDLKPTGYRLFLFYPQ